MLMVSPSAAAVFAVSVLALPDASGEPDERLHRESRLTSSILNGHAMFLVSVRAATRPWVATERVAGSSLSVLGVELL